VRVFTVHTTELSADSFSIGDLIDVCDVIDASPADLIPLLQDERAGLRRLRALAAVAWVLTRHDEPGLTFDDVLAGRVEVIGEVAASPADPTVPPSVAPPGANAYSS
jgi:hypothetical protein